MSKSFSKNSGQETTEEKIKKMYQKDRAVIIIFLISFLLVLAYFIYQANTVATDSMISTVIIFSGVLAGALGMASATAVLWHLKKNRTKLYREELENSKGTMKHA